ncbi:MAG: CDP-alcohol phosphatidyltransferase family protein [Anaerolineales bacterium]|nr:CDP-alcohol phosphatidyltransferase family protein [Anaerolineales bacterium]
MLDNLLRHLKDRLLEPLARALPGTAPIAITLLALAIGLVGIALLTQQYYGWALVCWLLNRLLDGLDGAVARLHHRQSDWGGYVDILSDYAVYAGLPVALVVATPSTAGYLSLGFLLTCFYINTASWMYLAAILEKRKHGAGTRGELTTITMPAGLIGGTETIIFYSLFLLWPAYLVPLYSLMAGLVLVTVGQRLLWASRYLREATVPLDNSEQLPVVSKQITDNFSSQRGKL